jgi:glutamyl-tRNA reductase
MGDKRKMKLSGELDYRIRYDVEHDLFHAQNVFNDEYITPTFVEYVQKLEKENAEFRKEWQEQVQKATDEGYARTLQTIQLTKAKEIIKNLMVFAEMDDREYEKEYKEAEQFLNSEVEK